MVELKVRDVMTSSVITLNVTDNLHDATVKFAINGISGAPVLDESGKLVGMLSESDILEFIKQFQEKIKMEYPSISFLSLPLDQIVDDEEALRTYQEISSKKVEEIMRRDLETVDPDAPLTDAIDLMLQNDMKRIPVMEHERVVGIITCSDIIWAMYEDKVMSR